MDRSLLISMLGNSLKVCLFSVANLITVAVNVASEALVGSIYSDDLDDIIRCFDKTTKHRFKDAGEPQYIKFGTTRDNDPAYNIRFGQLKLTG